jgi:hypothetical protein
MRYNYLQFTVFVTLIVLAGCGSSAPEVAVEAKISQQSDGSVSLKIEDATCYKSPSNPSDNTAEWNFVISKPGRYNVWIATATVDTMDLKYGDAVKISLGDEDRLEGKPVGNKIILDSSDVTPPYYRADSFMGTFYIQQAGEYNIQVISEKAIPAEELAITDHTSMPAKFMSVMLTPSTR